MQKNCLIYHYEIELSRVLTFCRKWLLMIVTINFSELVLLIMRLSLFLDFCLFKDLAVLRIVSIGVLFAVEHSNYDLKARQQAPSEWAA